LCPSFSLPLCPDGSQKHGSQQPHPSSLGMHAGALVDHGAFSELGLSLHAGPWPHFSRRASAKLGQLALRRDLYLHCADDAALRARYALLVQDMADKCQGCAALHPAHVPLFGGSPEVNPGLSDLGRQAWQRVLLALSRDLDLDCCTCLPSLVGVLLLVLSEEEAFAVARTLADRSRKALKLGMWTNKAFYLCTDAESRRVFDLTFASLAGLDADRSASWLDSLLTTVLPLRLVQSLVDHVVVKGAKSLYRFAWALAQRFRGDLEDVKAKVARADPVTGAFRQPVGVLAFGVNGRRAKPSGVWAASRWWARRRRAARRSTRGRLQWISCWSSGAGSPASASSRWASSCTLSGS
jgi:hypothetical protein